MNILGVQLTESSRTDTRISLYQLLERTNTLVVTPNAEMILAANENPYLKTVLNGADLSLCDSTAVKIASGFKLDRYPGVEAVDDLLRQAENTNLSVYILGGGGEDWANQALEGLKNRYPKLNNMYVQNGPRLALEKCEGGRKLIYLDTNNDDILGDIINAAPDILIVGFGHEKQELWLHEHLPHLPSVKIGIGAGGSASTLAGLIPRAPKVMRVLGLEWLFRLLHEPTRFKRIISATIIFPITVIYDHVCHKQ